MYSNNIPSLTHVADPSAAAMLNGTQAPPVAANTPLNKRNVVDSVNETRARKRMRNNGPTGPKIITDEELADAVIREHAVIAEHQAVVFPAVGAPAWFGPAITNVIGPAIDNVIGTAIANAILPLEIRIENMDFKRSNEKILAIERDDVALSPLKKFIAGNGNVLPGHAVEVADLPALAPFAVGAEIQTPIFPKDKSALRSLNHMNLSVLSALYNHDFGIHPGDSLEIRHSKFEKFIS
jgi:hypothetical protein